MDLLGFRIQRLGPKPAPPRVPDLSGDRQIEWMYVATRIGRLVDAGGSVLDFGCGAGWLSLAAASVGANVLSIDLLPRNFPDFYPNVEYRQVDVMELDETKASFDLVLNCSTIEHVGLGGRYGAADAPDGDLAAMQKLARLLKPGGHMLLTLPVGQDAVFPPLHRVYGPQRLPRLLTGYRIVDSTFWHKDARNLWQQCPAETVMAEPGNEAYYGLGCLVLQALPGGSPSPVEPA